MIDINELRRLAQTVQSPAHNINERMDALHTLHDTLSSGVVLELLNRLEAAESDALEQARLNGMGASREAALMAKLEAAEKDIALKERIIYALGAELNAVAGERDALRAKVEAMEKQEPVAAQQRFQRQQEMMAVWQPWQTTELRKGRPARTVDVLGLNVEYRELYALPGAKGE